MATPRRAQPGEFRDPRPAPIRFLAYSIYTVGTILCLTASIGILDRLAHHAPLYESLALIGVLIPWWITAGLGIRLGLKPYEYFSSVGRFLGLTRDAGI